MNKISRYTLIAIQTEIFIKLSRHHKTSHYEVATLINLSLASFLLMICAEKSTLSQKKGLEFSGSEGVLRPKHFPYKYVFSYVREKL